MAGHIFTGFGFGPIQSGLFVSEVYTSGNFERIVIAEIDQRLVDAVRAGGGRYAVNIAGDDGVEVRHIEGIEIYNPSVDQDRQKLLDALGRSTDICTSLPSVNYYKTGQHSVAALMAQGLKTRGAEATIVYTAENNNHAAEILEAGVKGQNDASFGRPVQFLNTVIGKMSQVIADEAEIADKRLEPIVPGLARAFLVETFNKILVTQCHLDGFRPGIGVFIEKEDLLPFEEAKLYGHNAIHALLAYLGAQRGCKKMAELPGHNDLMGIARQAFIHESGAALCKKHAALGDGLFTAAGFQDYADNLLARMTNPWLDDTVERAARDPQRKLGPADRIFGTMALCLEQGIEPRNMARGAAAGLDYYRRLNGLSEGMSCEEIVSRIWEKQTSPYQSRLLKLVRDAMRADQF